MRIPRFYAAMVWTGAGLWLCIGAAAPRAQATDASDAAKYNCDRECLKGITDLYFQALAQHDPSLHRAASKYVLGQPHIKLFGGKFRAAAALRYMA